MVSSNKAALLHRGLRDQVHDCVEHDPDALGVSGAREVMVDLGSAALLGVVPDARGHRLVAADHLVLAQDEVAHLFVVLSTAIIRETVHEVFHRNVVPTTSAEKFFSENVLLVEEDDHGRVQEAQMVSDGLEQLPVQQIGTFFAAVRRPTLSFEVRNEITNILTAK